MKEYLLLRNNVQSGPYTFEEMKSIGLKPFDLVWVENKSFSWRYPSEINELSMLVEPEIPTLDRATSATAEKATPITASPAKTVIAVKAKTPVEKETVAEENIPVAASKPDVSAVHVVAMKPHTNHIDIKTIKSSQQPKVVKVQVREKERVESDYPVTLTPPDQKQPVITTRFAEGAAPVPHQPERLYESEVITEKQSIYSETSMNRTIYQPAPYSQTSNKLEIIVLLVGAVSLLAVGYLLLTSSY